MNFISLNYNHLHSWEYDKSDKIRSLYKCKYYQVSLLLLSHNRLLVLYFSIWMNGCFWHLTGVITDKNWVEIACEGSSNQDMEAKI